MEQKESTPPQSQHVQISLTQGLDESMTSESGPYLFKDTNFQVGDAQSIMSGQFKVPSKRGKVEVDGRLAKMKMSKTYAGAPMGMREKKSFGTQKRMATSLSDNHTDLGITSQLGQCNRSFAAGKLPLPQYKSSKCPDDDLSTVTSLLVPAARSSAIFDKSYESSMLSSDVSPINMPSDEQVLIRRKNSFVGNSCSPSSNVINLNINPVSTCTAKHKPLMSSDGNVPGMLYRRDDTITELNRYESFNISMKGDKPVMTSNESVHHQGPLQPSRDPLPVEMEGDSECGNNQTLVCLIWHKGMLGAAIFNTETLKLQVMQDINENDNFMLTIQICTQTQPNVIIIADKQDPRFTEAIKSLLGTESDEISSCKLVTLPNKDLGFDVSRRRLQMACEASLACGRTTQHSLMSLLNCDQVNMTRAAGGILRYMELNSASLFTSGEINEVPVLTVEVYLMDSLVWIDRSTLSALRIIHVADHPSTTLGNTYTREGFSLYGLMDRCKSSLGKKKLKEWFLRPSRALSVLNERLDCLEFFFPPRNSELTQTLRTSIGKLRNMTRVIKQMKNSGLSSSDWLALCRVVQSLVVITEVCSQNKERLPLFDKFPQFSESINSLAQVLLDVIDVEHTRIEKHFTVRTNFDPELDLFVQRHRDLPDILGGHLTEHVRDVKRKVRSAVHIHFSSQLGCLLMIDITPHMERTGNYLIDGLELEFLTDEHGYYSTDATRAVTVQYGDVKTAITDRTLTLMYQLQNTILPEMNGLLKLLDLCAQLDCYIALSSYCAENNYVRPVLVNQAHVEFHSSRHPLLEAHMESVISNDVISSTKDVKSKITILTGPNASGKSIYLKQVVLIIYLAHIGCFVPAQFARVGLVDAIFTHFPIADSINSDVSTFTADLKRMSAIIDKASSQSLVVLDEFGKGTCPIDGAALLLSIVKQWLQDAPGGCPLVFLTTHFYSIASSDWLTNSPFVSFKMMDTVVDDDKVTYLYDVVDGVAQSSNATAIAKLLEIPSSFLNAGKRAADQYAIANNLLRPSEAARRRNLITKLAELNLEDEAAVTEFLRAIEDEP